MGSRSVQLQSLDASNDSILYQRRRLMIERGGERASQLSDQRADVTSATSSIAANGGTVSGMGSGGGCSSGLARDLGVWTCSHCSEAFQPTERVFRLGDEAWHEKCFLCAQCFQPFPKGIFYEFDGRRFCEHDFSALFKPCCAKCGNYIVGRVIRALQASWHPDCFACQRCFRVLTDAFVKSSADGRAICIDCSAAEKPSTGAVRRYQCNRCKDAIEEGQLLRYRGDNYHAYHFSCAECRAELTSESSEKAGQLYCVRCFDRLGVPVCARCRRPIDHERVVHAINRTWHVEHFVCAACEKPFNGTRHFERRGMAYCEAHYQQLFGTLCFVCGDTIGGQCVQACGKNWCSRHFACTVCDRLMTQRSKFYEYDLKPVCKRCYQRFPSDLRKRLAKIHKQSR